MHVVKASELPFKGVSRQFVGEENGDVGISIYLVDAPKDAGPGLHTHPYDEVILVRRGAALYTVDGVEYEAEAGDIIVVKAGEVHGFRSIGDEPLVQVDIHLGSRFGQHDL